MEENNLVGATEIVAETSMSDKRSNNEITPSQKRNVWVDLFRYILAFLVVCIHFKSPLLPTVLAPMYSLAVPLFFMMSGFYSYHSNENENLPKSKKAIVRNLRYLGVAVAIYVVLNIIFLFVNSPKDGTAFAEYFLSFFNRDAFYNLVIRNEIPGKFPPTYALWFMVALFEISVFHYVMVKFNTTRCYPYIACSGIVVYMFVAYYSKYVSDISIPLHLLRNWIFFGIPCFAIGYMLKKLLTRFEPKRQFKIKWVFLWVALAILFWGLTLLEAKFIGELEYYLSSILSSVAFLVFFDYVGNITRRARFEAFEKGLSNFFYNWIGVGGAFYIYVLHVAVGSILVKYTSKQPYVIVVFLISFGFYAATYLLAQLVKYLLQKNKRSHSMT